ncbi:2OG-Fe(II)-dependent halogenase WelO5 family protein [Micromonospora humida]|uniref:Proline hydroxylase n=1 Tax=Micromonospora humida TaxID=2809018 RepID=A0ABS2J0J0_9ACTN|nr:hypothetical protein [Micromonospora humida]MBM7079173.1 hypothetical protein [Micromonospora humida]
MTDTLTRDHLLGLACGLTAAVRVRRFVDPQTCAATVARLSAEALVTYDTARYHLPAARLGPVINEFNDCRRLDARYWSAAAQAEKFWDGESGGLRAHCLAQLGAAWQGSVRAASVHGRPLFYGIVRETSAGTLVHWDELVREFGSDLLDDPPIAQLAFNLFLSMPDEGGRTAIWRHRWDPRDEAHRVGFGYDAAAMGLDGCQRTEVRAEPGDAVLFDPRNFHAVQPGKGSRRLAVAFFVGVTGSGQLRVWS